jgi:hypothetical protein
VLFTGKLKFLFQLQYWSMKYISNPRGTQADSDVLTWTVNRVSHHPGHFRLSTIRDAVLRHGKLKLNFLQEN